MAWNWLSQTPLRAAAKAYAAAQAIVQLERDYFEGQRVSPGDPFSPSAYRLLEQQLQRHLQTLNLRLAEYQWSLRWVSQTDPDLTVLAQLELIDAVKARYSIQAAAQETQPAASPPAPSQPAQHLQPAPRRRSLIPETLVSTVNGLVTSQDKEEAAAALAIATTRNKRQTAQQALRFVALLLIVGLALQQISRLAVYAPLVDYWQTEQQIFVRPSAEEIRLDARRSFTAARDKLAFQQALGQFSEKPELYTTALRDEAIAIASEYEANRLHGIKNGLAVLTALIGVAIICRWRPQDVSALKRYMGNQWGGLDDSAKAFLIILSTDMFVGYHSAEGWEALLTVASQHLGLEENRTAILSFIAIVPVALDAVFKFWIFQYLKSTAPSTETIYKAMDQ